MMHTQIDWLSFTMLHREMPDGAGEAIYDAIQTLEQGWLPSELRLRMAQCKWTAGRGRAPYSYRAYSEEAGCSIYFGAGLTHTLYEFSGAGCLWLRENGLDGTLLGAVAQRITRLDIASDIETTIPPSAFVGAGYSQRMKSHGSFTSADGDTEYIGSQKSERYARVYRYNPPHPRSHLLRVEHVLRRDYAKQIASWLVQYGVEYVQASLGRSFGWSHPSWTPEEQSVPLIYVPRGTRSENGTVLWLIKQAAPAFKKAAVKGLLGDPVEFLKHWFLEGIDHVEQLGLQFPPDEESSEKE
jgi:hypothetical protein